MKKSIVLSFGLLILLAVSACASPAYYCYKTSEPVKVDGIADDPAWKDVPWLVYRDLKTAADADLDSRIKLTWDDECLYAFIHCEEPQVRARLEADEPEPRNLWRDRDQVMYNRESRYLELFLDPDADGRKYAEMHINAHGKINDHWLGQGSTRFNRQSVDLSDHNLHLEWDLEGRQIAVKVDGTLNERDDKDISWDVELALPWKGLAELMTKPGAPEAGDVWRMLALRAHPGERRRDGGKFWSWPSLGVTDAHQTIRYGLLIFSDHPAIIKPEPVSEFTWKLAWEWTLRKEDPAEVAARAKALGFNAFGTANLKILKAAGEVGLETYMVIDLSKKAAEEQQQVMQESDKYFFEQQSEFRKSGWFQFGGEPVLGCEIYQKKPFCLNHPEALAYAKREVDKAIEGGVDGIGLDGIGYRNYYACFCKTCNKGRAEYVKAHPDWKKGKAKRVYSRQVMDDFVAALLAYAREKKPDIKTTCHIYPHLRSDPLYGNRWEVDYSGQTAAWFFRPWWDVDKVRRYAYEIAAYGNAFHPNSIGAPLIAVHSMGVPEDQRRSAERIREEIRAVKEAGAQAIQFVELGRILNDPDLAAVVSEELGGSFHLKKTE